MILFLRIVQPKVHKLYRFHHTWLYDLNLCLSHVHLHQVFIEFPTILEVRLHYKFKALFLVFYQPNVFLVANVLHCLAKSAAFHKLEKFVLKLVGCLRSQSCIQVSISLESRTLLKLDYSVHFINH